MVDSGRAAGSLAEVCGSIKLPDINIGGILKYSLNDYPGKVSSVIFTQGCNLRCGFCHNAPLLSYKSDEMAGPEAIYRYLDKRAKMLDGLVITGGEPTCQAELPQFMRLLKDRYGLPIKLDTNGTHPEMLTILLDMGVVDYLAMDIKTSPGKYYTLTRAEIAFDSIEKSVDIIKNSGVLHEFRTTVIPGYFDAEDRAQIVPLVAGGQNYFLHKFVPENSLDKRMAEAGSIDDETLRQAGILFNAVVPCRVRG
jgi:pyruvate formate lyase activating enzyme